MKLRLIAFQSALRVLSMSNDALRARVKRRQIPYVRVGRRIYFDSEQLKAWIAEHSTPTSDDAKAASHD